MFEELLVRAEEFERTAETSKGDGTACHGQFLVPEDFTLPRWKVPTPGECLPPELRKPLGNRAHRPVRRPRPGATCKEAEQLEEEEDDDDEPPDLCNDEEEAGKPSAGDAILTVLDSFVINLESALIALAIAWSEAGLLAFFKLAGLALSGLERWVQELRAKAGAQVVLGLEDFGEAEVELDLSGTSVGGLEAEHVSELSRAFRDDSMVTALRLERAEVSDRSIAWLRSALMSNCALQRMMLGHNEIGDDGASSLAVLLERKGTLQVLSLEDNRIGSKGAARLATALKKNRTLRELDLSANKIDDEGAVRLSETLKATQSSAALTTLNLSGNPLGDRGIQQLVVTFDELSLLDKCKLSALFVGDRSLRRSETNGTSKQQRFVVTCSASGASIAGA